MKNSQTSFDEREVIHRLKHYLPAQAPLKDFIHHNTLHAFQDLKFDEATKDAFAIFGYNVNLSLAEYRRHYKSGRIREDVLEKVIADRKGKQAAGSWKQKAVSEDYQVDCSTRIGKLRAGWKRDFHIDLDGLVHPILFRILCSYLDQGISIWKFPEERKGFLAAVRDMERNSYSSFFKKGRARRLLTEGGHDLESLLKILVGDGRLYERYLYDQQFAHQGWSGMVSSVEDLPESLLDRRDISLYDLIYFETLLEIDALDFSFGTDWKPLGRIVKELPTGLFDAVPSTDLNDVLSIWQEAFEWSYYDQVLTGLRDQPAKDTKPHEKSFQALFCIDDRECSFRRYIEKLDPGSETFGTPGFFGVEFFFQPEHGKFHTKLCPAPVTPKFLVKELDTTGKRRKDVHFTKRSHDLFSGWLITQTLGFWSAFRLFFNIFRPAMSPATASSFRHMDKLSKLTIENKNKEDREGDLQVGFTIAEMADRAEGLLKSIGLVRDFASLVYVIGHGSSSVNNPHYAAYDCGACSGRPGSVNARVICFMANHPEVRKELATRGIVIPETTRFIGGLHDTTRDEIVFYDEASLKPGNAERHLHNISVFAESLDLNAKERARRFDSIDTNLPAIKIHEKMKRRSVSLFEPRPELNHATNALCIVGRRELSKGLFLDRRSFLNSFDYRVDPEGKYLARILGAAAPVCGGINLEYFFSRVDNQKLGAGTKLPHNVMGLFGVANGIDGDLRPGLPSQMIEVHEPVRLLIIVEHFPEVVLNTIRQSPPTYEWFINEWVNLVVIDPETRTLHRFRDGKFTDYHTVNKSILPLPEKGLPEETQYENLPVYSIS